MTFGSVLNWVKRSKSCSSVWLHTSLRRSDELCPGVQQPQFDAVGRTSVQTAFDLLEPDGWKPGCGQQDDLARGAVVGIGVDRVAIHACEPPGSHG